MGVRKKNDRGWCNACLHFFLLEKNSEIFNIQSNKHAHFKLSSTNPSMRIGVMKQQQQSLQVMHGSHFALYAAYELLTIYL